jgi:hypothetical protein
LQFRVVHLEAWSNCVNVIPIEAGPVGGSPRRTLRVGREVHGHPSSASPRNTRGHFPGPTTPPYACARSLSISPANQSFCRSKGANIEVIWLNRCLRGRLQQKRRIAETRAHLPLCSEGTMRNDGYFAGAWALKSAAWETITTQRPLRFAIKKL